MIIDVVGFTGFAGRLIHNLKRRFVVVLIDRFDDVFGQRLSINYHVSAINSDAVPGQPNHTLNIIGNDWLVIRPVITPGIVTIAWILENNNVTAPNLSLREEWQRISRCEDKFVYQEVVPDRDGVLHGSGWHFHSLHYEGHAKQSHDHGDHSRLKIFSPN